MVREGIMTLLVRNIIVSITLALSDFISFVISLYFALGLLKVTITDYDNFFLTMKLRGG